MAKLEVVNAYSLDIQLLQLHLLPIIYVDILMNCTLEIGMAEKVLDIVKLTLAAPS